MSWTSNRAGYLLALGAAISLAACQTTKPRYAGPLIQAPANCVDINFPIYFEPDSASVTREADRMIAAARERAAPCRVTGIDVLGLADAPGAADANYVLSQRRAKAVAKALRRQGFADADFHEAAAGAINATTASGASRPVRRRADVSIHLTSRTAPGGH
ncbi:MAG: OmpA family protein [Caulobacteraceae bacterium]